MSTAIAARLAAPGPKRMLALDGGGTRGALALGYLSAIEGLLGDRLCELGYYKNAEEFVLSDYFDMVGGTSVGSMIATMVALGWRVEKMRNRFIEWAPRIFEARLIDQMRYPLSRILFPKFDSRVLRGLLQRELLDMPLGSTALKTGLTIIAKRADTNSIWALNNNPNGRYFPSKGARRGNGDLPLIDLIQASTAAPSFFSPKKLRMYSGPGVFAVDDSGKEALFVDGGVSPHNNPALKMFMMAGIDRFNLSSADIHATPPEPPRSWDLGSQSLLIVSVGTGHVPHSVKGGRLTGLDAIDALKGMVGDGQELALALLQWFSEPKNPHHLDRIMTTLEGELLSRHLGSKDPLLSFQRYDVRIERDWLSEHLGRRFADHRIKRLQDFTDPSEVWTHWSIGLLAGQRDVKPKHFPSTFNTPWQKTQKEPQLVD